MLTIAGGILIAVVVLFVAVPIVGVVLYVVGGWIKDWLTTPDWAHTPPKDPKP